MRLLSDCEKKSSQAGLRCFGESLPCHGALVSPGHTVTTTATGRLLLCGLDTLFGPCWAPSLASVPWKLWSARCAGAGWDSGKLCRMRAVRMRAVLEGRLLAGSREEEWSCCQTPGPGGASHSFPYPRDPRKDLREELVVEKLYRGALWRHKAWWGGWAGMG